MRPAQEYAAYHIRTKLLKPVGKHSVTLPCGNHIVKDTYGLSFDLFRVKLHVVSHKGGLVMTVFMHGRTFT